MLSNVKRRHRQKNLLSASCKNVCVWCASVAVCVCVVCRCSCVCVWVWCAGVAVCVCVCGVQV